jgi:Fur family ferric uptake transcriptional regulator
MQNSFLEQLRAAGLKVTPARLSVLDVFSRNQKPLSMKKLVNAVKGQRIDQATVYRVVKSLLVVDLIRPVELRHGHAHYELVDNKKHHHHIVCDNCGKIEDITVPGEARLLARIQKSHQYQLRDHAVEMFGLCRNCQ